MDKDKMINTPIFESIERLKRLKDAYGFIAIHENNDPEHLFLIRELTLAINRERDFLLSLIYENEAYLKYVELKKETDRVVGVFNKVTEAYRDGQG
jgi:hypothetical protein